MEQSKFNELKKRLIKKIDDLEVRIQRASKLKINNSTLAKLLGQLLEIATSYFNQNNLADCIAVLWELELYIQKLEKNCEEIDNIAKETSKMCQKYKSLAKPRVSAQKPNSNSKNGCKKSTRR